MNTFLHHGFQIYRGIFHSDEIELLTSEADHIASKAGAACVRHLCSKSKIFRDLAVSEKIANLLFSERLHPVRSILFDKTISENWPVGWHQDLTICTKFQVDCEGYSSWSIKDGVPDVQPPIHILERMVTARIHLDPAGADNGALRVIPSSHLMGRLSQESISQFTSTEPIICECQPGDVLLMRPLILHSSQRSLSPSRRRIIHIEFAVPDSLDPCLAWHESSESRNRVSAPTC
jgi:ectoine hydroxylase-related dioxygenase (phytanoyl-CoA dioxygenase family)